MARTVRVICAIGKVYISIVRQICIAGCNWKEHCRLEEPDAVRALRGNKMMGAIRKLGQTESWPRYSEQEFKKNSILPFVNERALITVLLSKIQVTFIRVILLQTNVPSVSLYYSALHIYGLC